jgi:O-antigen biosynthesis protein WbqP
MSILIALVSLILLSPLLILVFFSCLLTQGCPIFFKQPRLGQSGKIFKMYKFRTMKNNTPSDVATHLLENPKQHNTWFGSFLRKYSIDEFPQLFNIIKGDMKFIGPRPTLENQEDLIQLRKAYGTIDCIPGVTGWAQINGRDKNTVKQKAKMELWYKDNKSFSLQCKIIFLTIKNMLIPDGIYPDKEN